MKIVSGLLFIVLVLASCGKGTKKNPDVHGNDTTQTLQLLNEQLENDPDNPNLLFERAKAFYNRKMVEKATIDIERAVSIDSSKAPFFILQSDIYYATNKIPEAKKAIEKAIQLDPKNRDANIKMGELQFYLKDYAKAFKYLDDALRIDPYYAKTYFIKGMCFKENGDTGLAISSFRTCVEQDPEYFHGYMQLGELMAAQHNPLAIDYYTNAIRVNSTMIEAYYGLAYFYQENGAPDKAITVYQDLLKIEPKNAPAMHNIGYTLLFKKYEPEKAIAKFTETINIDQTYVLAYYHRGVAYAELKNKERAEKDFRKVLEIAPEFDLAREQLKKLGVKP